MFSSTVLLASVGGDAPDTRAVQDRILAKILDDLIFSSRPEVNSRTVVHPLGLSGSQHPTESCSLCSLGMLL